MLGNLEVTEHEPRRCPRCNGMPIERHLIGLVSFTCGALWQYRGAAAGATWRCVHAPTYSCASANPPPACRSESC